MRSVTAALVLVFAACSTAGGDTTTKAPLIEPSTTTTAPTTTTTAEPKTTTEVEGCVERDGVLRNPRGFVCPPSLIDLDFVGVGAGHSAIHLPGTYETRLFTPRLRFTRGNQFVSVGENAGTIAFVFSGTDRTSTFFAWGGDDALHAASWPDLVPSARPDNWTWAEDIETRETDLGGYPATVTTFTANCRYNTALSPEWCRFPSPAFEGALYAWHGGRGAVIVLDTREPVTFTVFADESTFDAYWTETVQPILDSIEFLDQ